MSSTVASTHEAHRPIRSRKRRNLEVALPEPGLSMSQDAEWCVVQVEGEWRKVRFHDYDEVFSVPGLYERVFYDILECNSPQVVTNLLIQSMQRAGADPADLRVLDVGAGNGMVGERLAERQAELIVGVDIIAEAAIAAERDRPGVYDDYYTVDLTELRDEQELDLRAQRFNCMTCVAALGFADIPAEAFTTAYNLIEREGWIGFNIKEDFIRPQDQSGFAGLVNEMTGSGALEVCDQRRYVHRLGTDREPVYYVAFAGRKRRSLG